MAERALTLCFRPDDAYDVYYSQWAGSDAVFSRLEAADGTDGLLSVLLDCDWRYRDRITGSTVADAIDYLAVAAVYVVTPANVSTLLPLWLGLPLVGGPTDPGFGVLFALDSAAHRGPVRSGFRHLKTVLQEAIAAGVLTVADAIEVLIVSLSSHRCQLSSQVRRFTEDL